MAGAGALPTLPHLQLIWAPNPRARLDLGPVVTPGASDERPNSVLCKQSSPCRKPVLASKGWGRRETQ
jgi:hypothetical protein